MLVNRGELEGILLDHMSEHHPKLLNELRAKKELKTFAEIQVDAAMRILEWNLKGLKQPDPAGEIMARDYAVETLLELPRLN